MTEELRVFFIDLDFAVETAKENIEGKFRKYQKDNETIHKLMRMKYLKKTEKSYVLELGFIPKHLIDKVYD